MKSFARPRRVVVDACGTKGWFLHDQRHRDDGPAVEYANGTKWWYRHDELHREDGPAIELSDGTRGWYLRGRSYTRREWLRELLKDRPLGPRQRELLFALSENWEGTPHDLSVVVTELSAGLPTSTLLH